jgi:NAD(P)-dependent dehydrogenase (short-subunit alcohol dehydrogenase family)
MVGATHVAWVTGAGRGIGRACSLALAREGVALGLMARTEHELHATAEECRKHGATVAVVPGDVTKGEEVLRAHEVLRDGLGAPDILVNNAGIAKSAAFLKTTPDFLEMHWKVNVLGAFYATQAVLPGMIEKKWGRIVNIASTAGKVGAPYTAAYATSKHAVLGLTRSLAAEFAGRGITVNAVCPGYVDTPMTHENVRNIADKTGMTPAEALERLKKMSPQGRLTTPEEVAAVVVFLCSEAAGNLNGQAITIDGGAVQW